VCLKLEILYEIQMYMVTKLSVTNSFCKKSWWYQRGNQKT